MASVHQLTGSTGKFNPARLHRLPTYWLLLAPGSSLFASGGVDFRKTAEGTNAPGEDARETLVLTPRRLPSVFTKGLPATTKSAETFVSIRASASSPCGTSAVTSPSTMRGIALPERTTIVCPRAGVPAESTAGAKLKAWPSEVVVADRKIAVPPADLAESASRAPPGPYRPVDFLEAFVRLDRGRHESLASKAPRHAPATPTPSTWRTPASPVRTSGQ